MDNSPLQTQQNMPIAQQNMPTPQQPVAQSINGADMAVDTEKPKNHLPIIIGAIIVAIIAIVIVAILLVINSNNSNRVTMESVRKYCNDNNLQINEGSSADPKMDYIVCQISNDEAASSQNMLFDDGVGITFGVYDSPVLENESFKNSQEAIMDEWTVLAKSDNYLKMYTQNYMQNNNLNISVYLVIDGNTYALVIAANEDAARKMLLGIGYPDKDWASETDIEIASDKQPTIQSMQRNTQRKDDMARFISAINQYQANNRGNLPEGLDFWRGVSEFNCDTNDTACNFVGMYLNTGTESNDFTDPDGDYYSLFITENWFENGDITTAPENSKSELVTSDDGGYTIGGSSPFSEHIIYLVPGASCNANSDGIVKSTNGRRFAVLYMLENDSIFCTD